MTLGIVHICKKCGNEMIKDLVDDNDHFIEYYGLQLYSRNRKVKLYGVEIKVTNAEFSLLNIFLNRPERVYTRYELIDFSSGISNDAIDKTIDFHINSLRNKFTNWQSSFVTVRGVGFKISNVKIPRKKQRRLVTTINQKNLRRKK